MDAILLNNGGDGITPEGSITITNNGIYDVTEYADAVVALSLMKFTLLWTNSSPTGSFGAQTVTFTTAAPNDTKCFLILGNEDLNGRKWGSVVALGITASNQNYGSVGSYLNIDVHGRKVTASSSTQMTFSSGCYASIGSTNVNIPGKIYACNYDLTSLF